MAAILKYIIRYFPFVALTITAALIYTAYIITNTILFIFLSSFLFGAVVLLPFIGWLNLKNLKLERDVCLICSVGEDITFSYKITNDGFIPAFNVLIFEPLGKICNGEIFSASADYIAPHSSVTISGILNVSKRGLHNIGDPFLASYFPFSMFFYERRFRQEGRIMVLPKQMHFTYVPFLSSDRKDKGKKSFTLSEDREFAGLREYDPSDGMRMIYWPKSASMDKLIVKEFSSSKGVKACVVPDLSSFKDPFNSIKNVENAFEAIISAAAGIVGYCGRKGIKCSICDNGVIVDGTAEDSLKRLAVMTSNDSFKLPPSSLLKKNGISAIFVLSSNPSCNYKSISQEMMESRINLSFCFFDPFSFSNCKKNNKSNLIVDNMKNEGIPIYKNGDSPESVFSSSWTR